MRNLFQLVLQMSLTGGYVILILCLARFPLKKAPGWISRLIWAAALFRLLCPLTFRAPVSLIPAAVAEPSVPGGGTLFLGMTSGTASGTVSGAVPAAPGWAWAGSAPSWPRASRARPGGSHGTRWTG